MTDLDIITRIDQATGCQQCGYPLDVSASDDFCGQQCQQRWYAARTVPLVGYSEPSDLPQHIYNQVELDSPETRAPRFSGTVRSRDIAGTFAVPEQLRDPSRAVESIRRIGASAIGVPDPLWDWRAPEVDEQAIADHFSRISRALSCSVADVCDALDRLATAFRAHADEQQDPVDVRARALELRRNRNTGPPPQQRAPRQITPRRGRQ